MTKKEIQYEHSMHTFPSPSQNVKEELNSRDGGTEQVNFMRLGVALAVSALGATAVFPASTAHGAVRTMSVSITDTGFVPNHVVALVSQPIRITVTNHGQKTHQFSISKFRIYSENLKPGESSSIQFSPWQVGRFPMMSDPSGQNKPEFTGTFIVTDQK